MKELKAIDNPCNVCFKCLNTFLEYQLHKIDIPALGYGGFFDGFSTRMQLCKDCIRNTDERLWKLDVIQYGYHEQYKYEEEILQYVYTLPLEGQELFFNRFANGRLYYIKPQDWIDYKLDLLPHEKCKEYGLYSPQEKQAYQERFPVCKHVQFIKYNDGSKGCRCKFGASGNKDGTAVGHQTQAECFKCTHFAIREGKTMTVDLQQEEIKRIESQIQTLTKRLEELKGYNE